MYELPGGRVHLYAPQSQYIRFHGTVSAIKLGTHTVNTMAQEILNRSDAMDIFLSYVGTALFKTLHSLLENSYLHALREKELTEGQEVTKSNFEEVI